MLGIHNHKKEYAPLMTGQLAALYSVTGDASFRKEYLRRLKMLGFNRKQAETMMSYETDLMGEDTARALSDGSYLLSDYFDMKNMLLQAPYESYIEHRMFTVSEITKIHDEAEWHSANDPDSVNVSDEVADEFKSLGSYGREGLLVRYLESVAQNTGIPYDLIQKYSVAEQDLLILYKWNGDESDFHPYDSI